MTTKENESNENREKETIQFAELMAKAPLTEPERQYYFIEKLRLLLEGEGCTRRAAVVTFGCQMNSRDSEKITGILRELHYTEAEDEQDADFVLFNTCTIRENANEHLYGRLGRLKQIKAKRPDMIIAICGCMMQETDEVEKIRRTYPYVDLIFGTHNFYMFPELYFQLLAKRSGEVLPLSEQHKEIIADSDGDVKKAERLRHYGSSKNMAELQKLLRKPVVSVWNDSTDIIEDLPSERKFPFKQGVNIMFGCNNFCSYCIVPYVRGREKSREAKDILEEVRRLGKEGVKEIMLLGQNVNSYGKTLSEPLSFAELLKLVDETAVACGIERIRFMTSHPKDLSDELIEVMSKGKRICRQFHLPLQSGSSRILQRMNRHYDRETYLSRVEKLKAAMPDISISTDIIVGFPGETEEDFSETLKMVEEVRYDAAFTFIYSKREGTPAAAFSDQVPEALVKERFERLLSVQTRIAEENCKKLLGKTLPVLFEEVNAQNAELLTGRLENNSVVHVKADQSLIGSIHPVRLQKAHGFYYEGELL